MIDLSSNYAEKVDKDNYVDFLGAVRKEELVTTGVSSVVLVSATSGLLYRVTVDDTAGPTRATLCVTPI